MLRKIKKNILSEIIGAFIFSFFYNFFKNHTDSFLKNSNFVNFENIASIYASNKKILLNKSDSFFSFLDNSISGMKFEMSFTENRKYLVNMIKKFEKLNLNSYINFLHNDTRFKLIEKFKKIINNTVLLYRFFVSILLNYSSIHSEIRICRAPPAKLQFSLVKEL